MLFQLRGRGHPQDDATPNFCADSKRPILGLSNEVSFVPEIFGKMVKIKETSFLSTRGMILIFGNCMHCLLKANSKLLSRGCVDIL